MTINFKSTAKAGNAIVTPLMLRMSIGRRWSLTIWWLACLFACSIKTWIIRYFKLFLLSLSLLSNVLNGQYPRWHFKIRFSFQLDIKTAIKSRAVLNSTLSNSILSIILWLLYRYFQCPITYFEKWPLNSSKSLGFSYPECHFTPS